MNWWRGIALVLFSALLCVSLAPGARADAWNKKTILTFNQPVEVPGQVLQPGTYVFKLMDSPSNRNIVQIFDQDEAHLYATVLAIPDYRLQPTGRTVLMFEERPSGSPEAIQAWFYPGDNYGQEFVYPKSRALELARATNQYVPATSWEQYTDTTTGVSSESQAAPLEPSSIANTSTLSPAGAQVQDLRSSEVRAVGPSAEEVDVTQEPTTQTQTQTQQPEADKATSELPKTASSMPLVGLIGLTFVVAGGSLRLLLKQTA